MKKYPKIKEQIIEILKKENKEMRTIEILARLKLKHPKLSITFLRATLHEMGENRQIKCRYFGLLMWSYEKIE